MFAVYNNDGIYMSKDHRKIILFDTVEEATSFVNQFFQYAMQRAIAEEATKNPFILYEINMMKSNMNIEEFNYPLSNCETINFKNLER